jgi:hypothetical protein
VLVVLRMRTCARSMKLRLYKHAFRIFDVSVCTTQVVLLVHMCGKHGTALVQARVYKRACTSARSASLMSVCAQHKRLYNNKRRNQHVDRAR